MLYLYLWQGISSVLLVRSLSAKKWLLTIFIFFQRIFINYFFLKIMCLSCFFRKWCQEIKKNTKPSANGAKKCRNVFLHTTPLQQFSALPNKLLFSLSPESTGAHGHYRSIHGACHSWWQLYNRGAIGYAAMPKSAGLCWRFQRGMPSNWCNSPCFVWKVWLFGKSLWSPKKETYIFQALLGRSDSWW